MADAFPLSGSIDPRAFPFLIAHLHRQGATGSLKVDGPSYLKAVYFRGGRVLFGSSNDPKDQLGAILIESGRISPDQLEEVNAKVGPGNPLAKVLSDSGFVSQRELSEAARTKVERILSDILSYESGSFEFEDGVLPKGAVDLKLSSERLFLAAVRRVGDRNFVLRHLEGLDALLAPGSENARVLAEIEPDAGPAPRLFDGQRSVKEVAAEARVDEFEAAKVGCALLFLGAVEKSAAALDLGDTARAAVEPSAAPAESPMLLSDDDVPDLDLGLARHSAIRLPEPAPAPVPEPEPASASVVAPEPEPMSEPEPATILMSPEPEPPPAYSAPELEPVRARVEPATILIPPSGPAFEEEPPPPVAAAPPSKEDLAALDALLNARHVEGPLAPMEKRPEPNWEPHFGRGGRRPDTGSGRRKWLGLAAALVLLGGGTAAWIFLRPSLNRTASVPPPSSAPAATTPAAPVTTLAAELPTAPAPVAATQPAATAPATTARPAAATTTVPAAAPAAGSPLSAGLAGAREAFRRGDYRGSARSFEANLRAAKGSHTVQILVACSDETVQKAQHSVQAAELYIVPVSYQGRSCYRLLWGLFDSESRAQAAVAQVPAYFRENGAKPKAVSSASILP